MNIHSVNLDDDRIIKSEDYDNWVAPTRQEILSWPNATLLSYFHKLEADYDFLEAVWHQGSDPTVSDVAGQIVEKIYPTFDFLDTLLYNRHLQDGLRQCLRELDKMYEENEELLEKYKYVGSLMEPDRQHVFHLTIKELIEARRFAIERQIAERDNVSQRTPGE